MFTESLWFIKTLSQTNHNRSAPSSWITGLHHEPQSFILHQWVHFLIVIQIILPYFLVFAHLKDCVVKKL